MRILLLCLLTWAIAGCSKNNSKAGNTVELYQLSSFELVPGMCKVDSTKATLENTPFITNDEILQYDKSTHQFLLSSTGTAKVKALKPRSPFAVTVDRNVIYYGIYMPSIMSSTCFNSITMGDTYDLSGKVEMRLGYPGEMSGAAIDDQRNNAMLVTTLMKQGKLR